MKRLPVLVASLCAILADTAGATIIVVNPPVVTPVGSAFDWTYTVNLQPNSTMHSGDFFTIYDFHFADPSNVQLNTSFSALQATVQNVGTTPPDLTPIDDQNVSNVTVKLLSGEITDPMQGAQLELGKLTIRSATHAGVDSRYSAIADGVQSGGDLTVAVPEPGSIMFLLTGLALCGAVIFSRGRTLMR